MTDCKHDWHFIEGTERLRCERCKQETGPWTTEQVTVPTDKVFTFGNFKPNYNITFHNNLEAGGSGTRVGRMDFNGPEFVFEGDAAESAKVFMDCVANAFRGRLQDERQAELNACCDLLEGMHVATDGNHNYYLHAANELRKLRKP
jgi:hypothetical protein